MSSAEEVLWLSDLDAFPFPLCGSDFVVFAALEARSKELTTVSGRAMLALQCAAHVSVEALWHSDCWRR